MRKGERAAVEKLYGDQLRLTENDPATAAKLLGAIKANERPVPEAAALTAVGQIILSLDEFISRE